jgi:hypothetical protein
VSPALPADTGEGGTDVRQLFEHAVRDLEHIRDSCRGEQDRNAYFAALYGRVTLAVHQRAQAGRFDDPERMQRFVVEFARRYTEAFWARRSGGSTTRSWAVAFDAAAEPGPLVLQHLMLGMNAHINLDLGIVAATLARSDGSLARLEGDFRAINDVLGELVDRCQAAVVAASPALAIADLLLAERDEDVTRFSLRLAREGAWAFAQEIYASPAASTESIIAARDRKIAELGGRLLTRAGPADRLQRLLRRTEWRSVAEVTDLLARVDVS